MSESENGAGFGARSRGAVKICGVTTVADARRCVELGADLIGLNFHPPSPRCISEEQARGLRREIGGRALVAGVFVHHTPAEAMAIGGRVGLDLLQLHGDQDLRDLAPIAARSIAVLRAEDAGRFEQLADAGCWGVLFDAPLGAGAGGETLFGGTGAAWPYHQVANLGGGGTRVLLAGGIGPENAAQALAVPGVWGIDVCSRVESSPGVKDPARLEELFHVVRREPTVAAR